MKFLLRKLILGFDSSRKQNSGFLNHIFPFFLTNLQCVFRAVSRILMVHSKKRSFRVSRHNIAALNDPFHFSLFSFFPLLEWLFSSKHFTLCFSKATLQQSCWLRQKAHLHSKLKCKQSIKALSLPPIADIQFVWFSRNKWTPLGEH